MSEVRRLVGKQHGARTGRLRGALGMMENQRRLKGEEVLETMAQVPRETGSR